MPVPYILRMSDINAVLPYVNLRRTAGIPFYSDGQHPWPVPTTP